MIQAFLRRILYRPQQLWIRKAAFQVHLWSGILLSLYVIAIGVSGSILVFKEEFLPRPRAEVHVPYYGCKPSQMVDAITAVSNAYRDATPYLVSCPDDADPLIAITVRPRSDILGKANTSLTVFLHPETGAILGQATRDSSWVNIVDRFHLELLLGSSGRVWNGVAAALLLAGIFTGVVVWWPGLQRWRRALTVDFRRTWKRVTWDLHRAIGIWTVAFTLMWAVSGIYFVWPQAIEHGVARVSSITTATYPEQELARLENRQSPAGAHSLDLGRVLAEAEQRSPHASLSGIFYGSGTKPIFTVYMARKRAGDYANTDFLYFDQQTGEHLLTWHRGNNQTPGDWIIWSMTPLHFGTSWGLGLKIAWSACGLALPVLAITGWIMYWNRWLGKSFRNIRSSG